jgi:hypothetical protein
MTVMEPGSEILKVDEAGRIRTPPEKPEALLAEFDRSGMTGAQFARFSGVRFPTLMNWLQKRRKVVGQSEQRAPEDRRWIIRDGSWKSDAGFACWWPMSVRPRWRPRFCERWDWAGDVEFCWKPEGVRGSGDPRHAKGV